MRFNVAQMTDPRVYDGLARAMAQTGAGADLPPTP